MRDEKALRIADSNPTHGGEWIVSDPFYDDAPKKIARSRIDVELYISS